jgi:hypothetical protein
LQSFELLDVDVTSLLINLPLVKLLYEVLLHLRMLSQHSLHKVLLRNLVDGCFFADDLQRGQPLVHTHNYLFVPKAFSFGGERQDYRMVDAVHSPRRSFEQLLLLQNLQLAIVDQIDTVIDRISLLVDEAASD